MHRVPAARWLNRALSIGEVTPYSGVPLFLCPAVRVRAAAVYRRPLFQAELGRRFNHAEVAAPPASEPPIHPIRSLPVTCSGCGAFSQTNEAHELGYFDLGSKRVRNWLRPKVHELRQDEMSEDNIVGEALGSLDSQKLAELGIDPASMVSRGQESEAPIQWSVDKPPVCDRCYGLIHYNATSDSARVPMHHPTVESLRETIEESPYKYNHIYHVIDAADFPMSLVPRLNVLLGDIPLRSRNRRSRGEKYQHDRKTEMSFIITRGDLLAPKKEMVDAMMPYLREVLRDALGRLGGRVRLGNLKCVSARRGWWTNDVKEDIWKRGGAGWMVGKVNVGKSQLFEAVFPKGRLNDAKSTNADEGEAWQGLDVGELLPPAQPAQNYPDMPLVSSLPGTTASPIRVPFGNGKGELIDLPGLARSDLELYVKEEHRQGLIMKKRIVPEQVTARAGKSLILGGGLIRITPRAPDAVFLMYNFTPLEEHLTMTEKAEGFQNQTRVSAGIQSITIPGAGEKMQHAGTFKLSHDVTRKRAGPLTRKNAIGLSVDSLPFRVLSTDILIEGVGYVEIVVQVRARDFDRWERMQEERDKYKAEREAAAAAEADDAEWQDVSEHRSNDPFEQMMQQRRDDVAPAKRVAAVPKVAPREADWPCVDVYSPEGRFIASRKPIHGWLNNKPRVLPEHKKARPRKSMKGQKKKAKLEHRAKPA